MLEKDIATSLNPLVAFDFNAAVTATTPGNTIDTKGYFGLMYAAATGTVATADGSNFFTLTPQQAPDVAGSPGAWADVPSDEVIGTPPVINNAGGDDDSSFKVGSIGKERFQRLQPVETGTAAMEFLAFAILGDNVKRRPTPEQDGS